MSVSSMEESRSSSQWLDNEHSNTSADMIGKNGSHIFAKTMAQPPSFADFRRLNPSHYAARFMQMQQGGTPFGINDILNRRATGADMNCDSRMVGNSSALAFSESMASKAMYLHESSIERGHHPSIPPSTIGLSSGVGYPQSLTDLPVNPALYWPGLLHEDWAEKRSRREYRWFSFCISVIVT